MEEHGDEQKDSWTEINRWRRGSWSASWAGRISHTCSTSQGVGRKEESLPLASTSSFNASSK